MAEAGAAIKEIIRLTGHSRQLVRAVLCNTEDEVFRNGTSSLSPWLVALGTGWSEGCRNGAALWRRLRLRAALAAVVSSGGSRPPARPRMSCLNAATA